MITFLLLVIIIVLGLLGYTITYTNDLLFKISKELRSIESLLYRNEKRQIRKQ